MSVQMDDLVARALAAAQRHEAAKRRVNARKMARVAKAGQR